MKEIWVEIEPTSPEKEKLKQIVATVSDALVENNKVTFFSDKAEIGILNETSDWREEQDR